MKALSDDAGYEIVSLDLKKEPPPHAADKWGGS
jgi:hypothetical protein